MSEKFSPRVYIDSTRFSIDPLPLGFGIATKEKMVETDVEYLSLQEHNHLISQLEERLKAAVLAMEEGFVILKGAFQELNIARIQIRKNNQYSDALTSLDTDRANASIDRYGAILAAIKEKK